MVLKVSGSSVVDAEQRVIAYKLKKNTVNQSIKLTKYPIIDKRISNNGSTLYPRTDARTAGRGANAAIAGLKPKG